VTPPEDRPSEATRKAEQSEAQDAHVADRAPTAEEEEAAEAFRSTLSREERESIAEHERDMGQRGADAKGEGRPE
jgi:hypothetical protein